MKLTDRSPRPSGVTRGLYASLRPSPAVPVVRVPRNRPGTAERELGCPQAMAERLTNSRIDPA
jgi:hypothetical protein